MDSCALPDHPMIDRLWSERRVVHSQLLATGRTPGDLIVSALPLMRWARRWLRKPQSRPATPEPEVR